MDAYFATLPVDTAEDGEYPRYVKWRNFWRDRVDFGDDKLRGNLNEANRLYSAALADGGNICVDNTSQDLYWKPLGEQRMETASMGLISDAWVDTDDYKTLIVAPRGGGLFKTDDAMAAEVQWECITDPDRVPASGFSVIAVSSDAEVIVTSSRPTLWTHNYYSGVYYSTDGGDTWNLSEFPDFDQYGNVSSSKHAVRGLLMIEDALGSRKVVALTGSRIYFSEDDGATFEPFHFNLGADPTQWTDYRFLDMELDSRAPDNPDYQYTVWLAGLQENTITHLNVPCVYEIEIPNTSNLSGSVSTNYGDSLTRFNALDTFHLELGIRLEHTGGDLYIYYHPFGPFTQGFTRVIDKFNEGTETFTNFYETDYAWSEQLEISPDGTRMYIEPNWGIGCPFENAGTCVSGYKGRTLWRMDLVGTSWEARNMNWDYWGDNNPNTHADIRRMLVEWGENGSPDVLVVAHDGGVSYSTPGTGTGNSYLPNWQNKNGTGLNNQEMFSVSAQVDEKEVAYFASQDNNGSVYRGAASGLDYPWENLGVNNSTFRGDGYDLVFNQNDTAAPIQHVFHRTEQYTPYSGLSSAGCSPGVAGHGPLVDVDAENFLYLGHKEVFKYRFDEAPSSPYNSASSNTRLSCFESDFGTTGDLRVIHVPNYATGTIYAAKDGVADQGWPPPMLRKFFKCTNCDGSGPYNWTDIGPNFTYDSLFQSQTDLPLNTGISQGPLAFYGITDIATDPNDPDKLWVSFNGFNENGLARVYRSEDGGEKWYEYSDGLPQFPVNRLIYQEGSNDLLYAATDVGVYYRDSSMSYLDGGWKCFSNDLPICAVSDLEIDYCEKKLYASTMGRGAWITDIIEDNTDSEITIDSDETWDSDRRIRQTLITIETGNTLTIEAVIKLPVGAKIVVEPGAKLIVDGGTLTCLCGMWQGIQLHGNRYENQSWPTSTYQGIVELKNDAVIEQARVGIDVIDLADIGNSGGGIVKAEDATFLNCRKAVAFGPFRKHTNISQFTDVNFLTNAPLNDPAYGGVGTPEFVSIWDCYGIKFYDCNFEFEKDNPNFTTPISQSQWPTAITGHSAGYMLLKNTTGNTFKNLLNGLLGYGYWDKKTRFILPIAPSIMFIAGQIFTPIQVSTCITDYTNCQNQPLLRTGLTVLWVVGTSVTVLPQTSINLW